MKARHLWITAPYEVAVRSFELPDAPGPGQVLVETERSLISAGTELAIVMGTHIGFTTGAAWPRYPMALAAEGALSTEGLVSHHVEPEDARSTYRALAERARGYMGVILDWQAQSG